MKKLLFVFSCLGLSSCFANPTISIIDSSMDSSLSSSISTLDSKEETSSSQSNNDILLSWSKSTLANMKKVTSKTDITLPIPNGFTITYADLSYDDGSSFVFKVQDFIDFDISKEYSSSLLSLGFRIDVSTIESNKKENSHTLKYSFPGEYGLDSIDVGFYYFDGIFSLEAKEVSSGGYYVDESFPRDKFAKLGSEFDYASISSFPISKEYSFYQSYFYTGYGCIYGYIDLKERERIVNTYSNQCKQLGYSVSFDETGAYIASKENISLNYYLGDDNVFYLMIIAK